MRNSHGHWAVVAGVCGLLWSGAARGDEAATHYNLGLQLKRQGKTAAAIGEVEKAINLRPDYVAAHFTLGNLWRAQGDYDKARAAFIARQPMGRLGTPEEIAALVVYLASDASAYTTGQLHIIDGGWTA